MYVLVEPIKEKRLAEFTGAQYQALDWGFPTKVICFYESLKKNLPHTKAGNPDYKFVPAQEDSEDPEDTACYSEYSFE
jgi:hypothetical protein